MCMRRDIMLEKLERREVLKKQIAELGIELEKIETVLKDNMVKEGKTELVVGPYKVSYKDIVLNKFSTSLFKEKNPDDYDKYLVESSYKKFNVSLAKPLK